jgi:hypothetical protein
MKAAGIISAKLRHTRTIRGSALINLSDTTCVDVHVKAEYSIVLNDSKSMRHRSLQQEHRVGTMELSVGGWQLVITMTNGTSFQESFVYDQVVSLRFIRFII